MIKHRADCNSCKVHKCNKGEKDNLPKFCPMQDESIYEEASRLLEKHRKFFVTCSLIEKKGYGEWPRVRETIEFIKEMDFKRIGLAFCTGFRGEAKLLSEIFEAHGIELIGVVCKTGGMDKAASGIPEECKLRPGHFEAHCNPIAQALVLNKEKTDFNIILGLCVGHDSLFMKYSEALCTTLVTKDRVTGHNPIAAIYLKDSYMKTKLGL